MIVPSSASLRVDAGHRAKAHQPRSEHHRRIRRRLSGEIYLNPVTLGRAAGIQFVFIVVITMIFLPLLRRINTGERQEHCGRRISLPVERAFSNGT